MRIVLILATATLVAGCGTDDPSVIAAQRGRPVIVAAFWPLAEVAREVAGDAAVVINLTPVGDSPHEIDLTPRQRDEVMEAALAVVLGAGFQPDIEAAAADRAGTTIRVLDELELPDRAGESSGPPDPHVWLDPTIMGSVVTLIADGVAALVPEDADDVRARGAAIVERNVALDAQIEEGLESCERNVIATHHEAFDWYAARYGLRNVALDGIIPDDDPVPTPHRLDALGRLIDDGSVVTLFAETLLFDGWIDLIADEHRLDVAVLNPYEGLTTDEDADGLDYETVQLGNLRVLREHLDCAS